MIPSTTGLNQATLGDKKIFDEVTDQQSIDFVNYCNRKVRKFSSGSSVLLNNRKHPPRKITTLNDFAISYFSKGPIKDLNGKSKEPLIECRHLAYWWIKQDKLKYDKINTLKKLQNCKEIPSEEVYNREVLFDGCASEVVYFDLPRFPEALHEIASGLKECEKKRWHLESTDHSMALSIKCRNNRIVIKYYDPNDTLRHKKIVVKSLSNLKRLTSDVFWDDQNKDWYFKEKNKVGCLISTDRKAHRDKCQVTCMANPSETLRYHLLNQGHYGHRKALIDNDQIDLSAKRYDGVSGFFVALQNGNSEAVKDFMQKVLASSDLSAEQKKELLAAKETNGTSGFFMALQEGFSETVKIFLEGVLASDLSDEQKKELLAGKDQSGAQGLFMALQKGHSKTVEIFLKLVLASDLSEEQKVELLAAKDEYDRFGFYMALPNGHSKTVEIFLKVVLESRYLSFESKATLLIKAVRFSDNNNIGGLALALHKGHTETVEMFLKVVLEGDYLDRSSQENLLLNAVGESDGPTWLSEIFWKNNNSKALKVFREKVLASQLSEEIKQQLVPQAGRFYKLFIWTFQGCLKLFV